MSQRDGKMSQADIAREYMIAHAREAAGGVWRCNRCETVTKFPAEVCDQCGAQRFAGRPKFPSPLKTRRAILEAIAKKHEKYARPFDHGNVASVSLIGTESWAEYGEVVLQMATLDTLMLIEEKLTELLERLPEPPPSS